MQKLKGNRHSRTGLLQGQVDQIHMRCGSEELCTHRRTNWCAKSQLILQFDSWPWGVLNKPLHSCCWHQAYASSRAGTLPDFRLAATARDILQMRRWDQEESGEKWRVLE